MPVQEWLQSLLEGNAGTAELFIALLFGTFASEDVTCVVAGLLVAAERLGFHTATAACALGIYLSDLGLYAIGRSAAAGLLRWNWVQRKLPKDGGRRWRGVFDRRGVHILVASRFLPGARLPTYLTAGAIRWPLPRFALVMAGAVLLWTPLVIGLASVAGEAALGWLESLGGYGWIAVLLLLVALWLLLRTVPLLFTWRGRRALWGGWLRWTRFEFASRWRIYTPVVLSLVWRWITLGKCCTDAACMFTACNPGIPHGGMIGESKGDILAQMPEPTAPGSSEPAIMVARYAVLQRKAPMADRLAVVAQWLQRGPVVLKPDQGERGNGVAVVRDLEQARAWLMACPQDAILQEFIPGEEFGVVWRRTPGDQSGLGPGEVRSIARKVPPAVTGDGMHSLADLILKDPHHVAMAAVHLRVHGDHGDWIPPAGEPVALSELGTHCRGATFLDAAGLHSEALTAALNDFMAASPGLDFGRFDLRVPDDTALIRGEGIRILEFNGVTGEPGHIYHPGGSWWAGVRDLCRHWWAAAATGAANRDRGHAPTPGLALLRHAIQARGLPTFEAQPEAVQDSKTG